MCVVVNIHHGKGYDVYIGRPGKGLTSIWGNPFKVGVDGTLEEVLEKYKDRLIELYLAGKITREDIMALDGKRLGCFCKPKACHGDILVAAVQWLKDNPEV